MSIFDEILKPIFAPGDLRDVMRRYGEAGREELVGTFPKEIAERFVAAAIADGHDVFIREEPEAASYDDEPDYDDDGYPICSNPKGHEWACTGSSYGGDDESYHGEGRCYCIWCGADGDA
jgi:hypothetical protein